MTILARTRLLELIRKNIIKIKPFNPKLVSEGSVDFTLGNTLRIFDSSKREYDVRKNDMKHIKAITKTVELSRTEKYLLMPGELIFGVTKESIELPKNICAWIQGKSSLARIGLMVHLASSFIHPGSKGVQVLEMINLSPMPIAIYPGVRICQIIFEETAGTGLYRERFYKQTSP